MVKAYEDLIVPAPPTQQPIAGRKPIRRPPQRPPPPPPQQQGYKPNPAPNTKIIQLKNVIRNYTKSFEVAIKDDKDPLKQLVNARKGVEYQLKNESNGFKFFEALNLTLEKNSGDKTLYKTLFL